MPFTSPHNCWLLRLPSSDRHNTQHQIKLQTYACLCAASPELNSADGVVCQMKTLCFFWPASGGSEPPAPLSGSVLGPDTAGPLSLRSLLIPSLLFELWRTGSSSLFHVIAPFCELSVLCVSCGAGVEDTLLSVAQGSAVKPFPDLMAVCLLCWLLQKKIWKFKTRNCILTTVYKHLLIPNSIDPLICSFTKQRRL